MRPTRGAALGARAKALSAGAMHTHRGRQLSLRVPVQTQAAHLLRIRTRRDKGEVGFPTSSGAGPACSALTLPRKHELIHNVCIGLQRVHMAEAVAAETSVVQVARVRQGEQRQRRAVGQTHDRERPVEAGLVASSDPLTVVRPAKASRILQGKALRAQHASASDALRSEVDRNP